MAVESNPYPGVELIEKFMRGDPVAVTDIFNQYFDRVYNMVYYSVGRDREIAEDITQETFLSAFKSANKFKGNSNLHTWLVGIASHKIADHFRRLQKEKMNLNALDVPSNEAPDSVFDDPGKVLDSLPLTYRQVLLLKYVEEMSVAEIGRVMHKTEKSVEGLLSRTQVGIGNV